MSLKNEIAHYNVAIVGSGACATAILIELIARAKAGYPITSILIFEKSNSFGPGLAYSSACEGTGLNMRSETMGLRADNPGHFVEWLESKNISSSGYLPRTLYGEYLSHQFTAAVEEGASLGVEVRYKTSEVVALRHFESGYSITTIDGRQHAATNVVLALGNHMSAKHSYLEGEVGYFPNPWPNKQFKNISQDATIAIIGSRLTALDVALYLKSQGHVGPINLLSRSGRIPKVQSASPSKLGSYKLFEIAREGEEQSDTSLSRLIAALRARIEQDGARVDWQHISAPSLDTESDLANDISVADAGNIGWQDVLVGTAPVVERYWKALSDEDKAVFLDQYQSIWMIYRHAMPLATAKTVLGLIQSGQLSVMQITGPVAKIDSGFVIPHHDKGGNHLLHADYVVDATGPDVNPLRISSRLLHNCLGSGLVEADPFGGIRVDHTTLEASPNLHVVGSLTRGTHFYSTAIDRNVAHAQRIVDRIVRVPARRSLHIAFFVGTDLCSQLIVSKLVPLLIRHGHMPYVFLPAHKTGKKTPEFEVQELAFFERQLLREHIAPYLDVTNAQDTTATPVGQLSAKYGILVEHVDNVNDPEFLVKLSSHHIDIGMSIRCYQKFGKDIINYFQSSSKLGLLNLHPGALPQYRGVMTMIRAMANQESTFGFSLHSINEEWDAGQLVDIQGGNIDYNKDMLSNLLDLHHIGVNVALDAFVKLGRGTDLPLIAQDESRKAYYSFPTRKDLDEYQKRGLKLVDAEALKQFIVANFSSPETRNGVQGVVEQAVRTWHLEHTRADSPMHGGASYFGDNP